MRLAIQSIPHIFAFILNTLQADAGDLLLTRQGGRSLLLACHTGEASRAFEERLEFQPGEGFPGLTLATGSLSESSDLLNQKRFLRDSVKRAGFRRYIGAPIIGPSNRHGVIGVAFRDPNPHLPLLPSIITAVCALLGLRLEAVMAPLQAAVRNYLTHAGNVKEQTDAMHRMLEQIARFTDASNAELSIANEGTSPTRIATPSLSGPQCSLLASSGFAICPAYTSGQALIRQGSRQPWRTSPHPTRKDMAVWCYAPLQHEGMKLGVIRVRHTPSPHLLPSDTLVLLMQAAEMVSRVLWERSQRARTQLEPPRSPTTTTTDVKVYIRCFGTAELRVGNRVITSETIVRKKVLTLLKILTTFRGQLLHRDQLIEWLWPESDPLVKRAQFYVLVHELRRLLEPEGKRGEWQVITLLDGRYAPTRVPSVLVDAVQFEQF